MNRPTIGVIILNPPDPDLVCGALLPDPSTVWEEAAPKSLKSQGFAPHAPAPIPDAIPDLPPLPHHQNLTPEQEVRKLRWELSMCEDSVTFHRRRAEIAEREIRPLRDDVLRLGHVAGERGFALHLAEQDIATLEWLLGATLVSRAQVGVWFWRIRRRR